MRETSKPARASSQTRHSTVMWGRSTQIRFGGTIASSCPSTAHAAALDLRANGLDSFTLEPPGFQLHRWVGGVLFTHTLNVGKFDGPFPFH